MKRFRPAPFFSPVVPALAAALLLSACAGMPPRPRAPEAITAESLSPQAREHRVWLVSADHQLQLVRAGRPDRIEQQVALRGLAAGDEVVGIDFRVARGVLYLLTRQGRLYTVDTGSGQLAPVGSGAPLALALPPGPIGFDFNPAADRIRIVGAAVNLRAHPDTGALVDGDPKAEGLQPDGALRYAEGDPARGRTPRIDAAGYTYNKTSDKLTTNYAIDQAAGTLVMQGSLEGATPAVFTTAPSAARVTLKPAWLSISAAPIWLISLSSTTRMRLPLKFAARACSLHCSPTWPPGVSVCP